MADLRTTYMGIELKNPVIVGSNNLVTSVENLQRIEKAGAAAVVYKSLLEEQIQLENLELSERKSEYVDRHAEMVTIFPGTEREASGPEEHLHNLKKAKESVSIPVFASLNAIYDDTWVEYAKKIEETGVDGIELNFYTLPEKSDVRFSGIEKKHIQTLKAVKSVVKIPVAVKLSPFYSNPLQLIHDLDKAGADAFVLFNRLFQPDIDVHKEEHIFPFNLSNSEDKRLPLRFAGLLHGNIEASICSSSGIFSGYDVVKMLLAGADCVQIVSILYLNQIEIIESILQKLEEWMDTKGYKTIDSFRGKLSNKKTQNKLPYQRAQYSDILMNATSILKRYKIIN
jgi:dihydroorotate dehydrogenase (fumarate)